MDVRINFDGTLLMGDISLAGADLASDQGLYTAVVISLFSDARARQDDKLPARDADKRGWWGVALSDTEDDQIGSRLWLLSREKQLPDVLIRAEEYAREALEWLVDGAIARSIDVIVEAVAPDILGIKVIIEKPNGEDVDYLFSKQWSSQ